MICTSFRLRADRVLTYVNGKRRHAACVHLVRAALRQLLNEELRSATAATSSIIVRPCTMIALPISAEPKVMRKDASSSPSAMPPARSAKISSRSGAGADREVDGEQAEERDAEQGGESRHD